MTTSLFQVGFSHYANVSGHTTRLHISNYSSTFFTFFKNIIFPGFRILLLVAVNFMAFIYLH